MRELLSATPLFTRRPHSRQLCMFDLEDFIYLFFRPDATPEGSVPPPRIKPHMFCLVGKCVNHYIVVY